MLKQRVLTAIVLAPLALYGVFGLPLGGFLFVLDAVVLLAAWEWANLSHIENSLRRMFYVVGVGFLVLVMHAFYAQIPVLFVLALAAVGWLAALFWVLKYPRGGGWHSKLQRMLIGLVVLLPCWLAFAELKAAEDGELLILLLLLLVWGADVGAYFSGKKFGTNKLAPHVSPGKTREGLYGGLVTCLIVAVAFAFYVDLAALQVLFLIVVALVTGLVSVLGDLFESMLKRYRGIKDSSQLLPGHGGILDRIDSLTAASPVFVLGMQYLVVA